MKRQTRVERLAKSPTADYRAAAPWYTACGYTGCVADESREVHQRRSGDSLLLVAHRDSDVLILESPARAASRKKLARMVGKVRRAARELSITPEQIAAEVAAVRRERARRS